MDYMKHESWVISVEENTAINLMDLTKHFCLNIDWDSIVDQAYDWCKENHYLGSWMTEQPTVMDELPKARQTHHGANKALANLWSNTEKQLNTKGPRKVGGGFITRFGGVGSRAGPIYGCTIGSGAFLSNYGVTTIIHELTHIAHLTRYYAPVINGKRRPHDLFYNKIMLMAMNEGIGGLTSQQLNPLYMGYTVGEGYAPTISVRKVIEKLELGDSKISHFITTKNQDWLFLKSLKAMIPKKKRNTRQRGAGAYATAIGEIDIDKMSSECWPPYEIQDLPNGYNYEGRHYDIGFDSLKEAYAVLGTYDKDEGQYTGDGLDRCEKDCECEWNDHSGLKFLV